MGSIPAGRGPCPPRRRGCGVSTDSTAGMRMHPRRLRQQSAVPGLWLYRGSGPQPSGAVQVPTFPGLTQALLTSMPRLLDLSGRHRCEALVRHLWSTPRSSFRTLRARERSERGLRRSSTRFDGLRVSSIDMLVGRLWWVSRQLCRLLFAPRGTCARSLV
jgi:hypothetical protein